MAIYTYHCPICYRKAEVVQSIKDYCVAPRKPVCCENQHMERYLTPVMTNMDTAPWDAYKSPIDGTVIDSRAKRNEHMAKHDVVMFDEIKPDVERARKRIAKEQEVERRNDIIESVQQVYAGHKPQLEVADQAVHQFLEG